LKPWSKVSIIDASHFDAGTAYAAINSFRLDDLRAQIYRTRDFGKSWTEITKGIPGGGRQQRGAGRSASKGFALCRNGRLGLRFVNDGDDWQPLQLNLPHTSMRDLQFMGRFDCCHARARSGFLTTSRRCGK